METKIIRSDSEQSKANEMFSSLRNKLLKRDLSNYARVIFQKTKPITGIKCE